MLLKGFFSTFFFLHVIFSVGQSINASKLKDLIKKGRDTHSEALIVCQNDSIILEEYFDDGNPTAKIETMSCTKSIVGLAVACLLSDGLLKNLDEPIYKFYPEWKQGQKQLITVGHLLTMTSGIQNNPNASIEIYPSPDFVKLALSAELSHQPGAVWNYNNKALNLIAGVVQKITGKRMDVFIGQRLFLPLGITDFSWSLDSAGNPHVMSGCQIRPRDFLKLGTLILNKGRFQNSQIIQSAYIGLITTPVNQFKGYGLLWWLDYDSTISIIDDSVIAKLSKASLPNDFIEKAKKLKGTFYNNEAYYKKVESVFGADPWESINELLSPHNLALRRKEYKGEIKYRADGYLGNYMVVDPVNKLIGVRMISHKSFKNDSDNFYDFSNAIYNLVKINQ